MRIRWIAVAAFIAAWFLPVPPDRAEGFLRAGRDGGQGADVNLVVREIRVSPVRVRAGEPVRIEIVVENRMEGHGTVWARVTAGGREVDGRFYTYGWSEGARLTRESFTWDTTGARPGAYRIRGEVHEPADSSPFDNAMEAPDPVVVLEPGSAEPSGGSTSARDSRYRPALPTAPEDLGGY